MIEVWELDRRGTLASAEATLAEQQRLDARQLEVAVHWADLHHPDSLPPVTSELEALRRRFDGDLGTQPGGEGTPPVRPSGYAELGLVLQTSAGGAKHLIADALDLRHRLPALWREVQDGRVRAWKARRVAAATRHLPFAVMGGVDAGLAGLLATLAWSRFEAVLDATVQRADPVGARLAEAEAASRRFVALGRDGGRGLKTLIARGEVLDILTFLAAVNRVADLLELDGDDDTVEVRRSRAVGILGQPDQALALLARHQHDDDVPPAPVEPRPRGGWCRPRVDADERCEPDEPESSSSPEDPEGHTRPGPRDDDAPDDDHCSDEPGPELEAEDPGRRAIDLTQVPPAGKGGVASVRVQLYVHLTDAALNGTDPVAVCRVEGVGPITAATVRRWLRGSDARITVRPVAVPGQAIPVDAYEIPQKMHEAVLLRNPASAFPWSGCTERRALQLDHVHPYLDRSRGGPRGQTGPENLAPLVQTEHQAKTSGRWQERTPAPGVHLWRSPHGWIHLVTNQGTFPLGHDATAQAIWRATGPAETAEEVA